MKKNKTFKPKRFTSRKQFRTSHSKSTRRARFYDAKWDKYRRRFLHYNKQCYCCGQPATVVDHIQAHKTDLNLFTDVGNHMPMCHGCHSTVTGLFDRHENPDLEGKLKWIAEQRKHFNVNVKVRVLPSYEK